MKKIAEILLEKGAVQVRTAPPFTWVSGIKSPVYCDNRKMLGFVGGREEIVEAFKKLVAGLRFDVIGGTATAAIPWAAFLAQDLKKPMIYIRPEKKEHGAGKQIEGFFEPGLRVLIVEDLISTGGSSVNAAQAVRDAGCIVEDIVAIVSWELPKSKKAFDEANLKLHVLTGYADIIGLAAEKGFIEKDKLAVVMKFKEDPEKWLVG